MPELTRLDRFTSTGVKFWRHREAMESYRAGTGNTVVSTHISPEGACPLKCPYCSVTYRDTHRRIPLATIMTYVRALRHHGLKAVILTGGGEPTAYPWFDTMVDDLAVTCGMRMGLITNGVLSHRPDKRTWCRFDWVRVSVNFFEGWEERIRLPERVLLRENCVVGLSTVFTPRHEAPVPGGWKEAYRKVSALADRLGATYVRVLPDCLLPQEELSKAHEELDAVLHEVGDDRFFHQRKNHARPSEEVCHQSFFRPYLSEEPNPWDGEPGTVFPCDSVVLNRPAEGTEAYAKFTSKYALCRPSEIEAYLDGKIAPRFRPCEDCRDCVFTRNVEMLGAWKRTGEGTFIPVTIPHEDFV